MERADFVCRHLLLIALSAVAARNVDSRTLYKCARRTLLHYIEKLASASSIISCRSNVRVYRNIYIYIYLYTETTLKILNFEYILGNLTP